MTQARRILALVLALLVGLLSYPMALAEGTTEIVLDQTFDIVVGTEGERVYFAFTPAETGTYVFETYGGYNTFITVYDAEGAGLAQDDDSGDGLNCLVGYTYQAGQTYTLEFSMEGTGTVSAQMHRSLIAAIYADPMTLIQGYDSQKIEIYDDQGNVSGYWHHYEFGNYWYQIELTDGTVWDACGPSCYAGDRWLTINFLHDQDMDHPWLVGDKQQVTIRVEGFETTVAVSIEESPVVSVSHEDVELIAGAGNMVCDEYYDAETDSWSSSPTYMHYPVELRDYTVTLKDGTKVQAVGSAFEYQGKYYEPSLSFEQDYNHQWSQGNSYPVTATIWGYEHTFNATVVPSPVKSVTVEPIVYIEGTNADLTCDWDGDQYTDYYSAYHLQPETYTITLQDGTQYKNEGFEYKGQWYSLNVNDPQSFENQWNVGTYTVEADVAGYQFTYPVTIVENPVASVTFEHTTVVEHTDGEYIRDYIPGESPEDNGTYTDEYYCYDVYPNYTITLKDGTTYGADDIMVYQGREYGMTYYNGENQSYEQQWTVGNTYYGVAELAGVKYNYPVTIEACPVEKVEVEPVTVLEGKDGYYDRDWIQVPGEEPTQQTPEYFVYSFSMNGIKVTLKDGTVFRADQELVVYQGRIYDFTYYPDDAQSYETAWTAGNTYPVKFSVLGYEGTFDVTVAGDASNDTFQAVATPDGVIITDYLGDTWAETLEIPATLGGKPVIGVTAFENYNDIKQVVIPDSVVTLGDDFFGRFNMLNSVTLGAGVKNLTQETFLNCWDLESISVGENNPYFTTVDGVLYNKEITKLIACPIMKEGGLTVPKTCTDLSVLDHEFYAGLSVGYEEGHPDFITVDGVTYSKDMKTVVSCNKAKAGEYIMPDSVETIAPKAFLDCTELTKVTVAPKVTEIVYSAFAGCENLSKVELPQGVVSIGEYAFGMSHSLKNIDLPDSLQTIETEAFYESGLTRLVVPDSVKEIAGKAFQYSQISLLDLGKGVQSIGVNAFFATPVKYVTLPDSLTNLGAYAFAGCGAMESLKIGKGLTQINPGAFEGSGLASVTIPATVEFIGESAFANGMLQQVDIQNPACKLDDFAFANCELTSLTLGNEMTAIPEGAFRNNNIKELTIPESVTSLVYGAFWSCQALETITLPKNLTHVGGHVFDDTLWFDRQNDGVVKKDYVVFGWKGDKDNATSFALEEGLTLIADYAFEDCDKLQSVTLPQTAKSIGAYAFYGCKALEYIRIPASVTYIGEGAFRGCQNLTNMELDAGNPVYELKEGKLCDKSGNVIFDPVKENTVAYLDSFGGPYKTHYQVGDTIDTTGIQLLVGYQSGFYEFISDGYTVEAGSTQEPGWVDVVVTYGGKTVTYTVTVAPKDEPHEKQITGAQLLSYPTKKTYLAGEPLDTTGLKFKVYYSDGTTQVVQGETLDTDYLTLDYSPYKAGPQTVWGEYYSCQFTFAIVVECTHENQWVVSAVPSTCCVQGHEEYVLCSDCGQMVSGSGDLLPLDKTNHAGGVKKVGYIAPTCLAEGYTGDGYCVGCGEHLHDGKVLDEIGHRVENWTVTKEASASAGGEKKGTCVHCKEEFTVQTGKLVTGATVKTEGMEQVTLQANEDTVLPEDAMFVAKDVSAELDYLQEHDLQQALLNAYGELNPVVVLDLSLVTRQTATDGAVMEDEKVDFDGAVTVTIPLPDAMKNSDKTYLLYHVKDDGTAEAVEYTVEGDTITFVATGFSYYTFAYDPYGSEAWIPIGDINQDGQINAKDALLALRMAVGKYEASEEQWWAGDVNEDGDVNAKDALEILKFAVGKPSKLDAYYGEE